MRPTIDAGRLITRDRTGLPLVAGLGLLGWLCIVWLLGGFIGLGAGLGLVCVAVVLSEPLLFAVAQFLLTVLLPAQPALSTILLAEAPLVVVLLSSFTKPRPSWHRGSRALVLGGGVLGIGIGVAQYVSRLWVSALAVAGVTALGCYALHRYSLVLFTSPTNE